MSLSEPSPRSRIARGVGWAFVLLGVVVFSVRLLHDGAYPVPRRGNLFGGVGALAVGGLLLASVTPRVLRWVAIAASPVVLFFALYATLSELEEVVSLYATDAAGRPAELRLWVVERDGSEWLGMQRSKAEEHALDGVPIDMLRAGATRCVVPRLHDDRPTVEAMHALKLEKYAVARIAAAVGLYPSQAPETSVALRLEPCPAGS